MPAGVVREAKIPNYGHAGVKTNTEVYRRIIPGAEGLLPLTAGSKKLSFLLRIWRESCNIAAQSHKGSTGLTGSTGSKGWSFLRKQTFKLFERLELRELFLAQVAELVDAADSKSAAHKVCWFDSSPGH